MCVCVCVNPHMYDDQCLHFQWTVAETLKLAVDGILCNPKALFL